ncbi:hypothetical protein KM043_017675 [Ampulex compressa]|nr:hypothetical protein KM043_017675 [Ampulex compressa]
MDNDVTLLYGTEQKEGEPKEDPIVIEEETNDIGDAEEINDGREYVEQRQEDVLRRRGDKERLHEQGVRRSEGIGNKKQQANIARHVLIPMNFTQASNSAEADEWHKAIEREISALDRHKVWKIVPRNKNMKIMKSKWIYNLKDTSDSNIERYKAILVAVGSSLRVGWDYEESFSPVIKLESFRVLMAIASIKKMRIKQYNVRTAYLYANLDKAVYMEQPEGFITRSKEDYVYELEKSIYGLPQSGRHWNEEFDRTLKEVGLESIPEDPCVYKFTKGKQIIIIGTYVDDCIVIGTEENIIDELMSKLRCKFDLKEIRGKLKFLNIGIEETVDGIYLSQEDYIDKILNKFGLEECNTSRTPASCQQNLNEYEDSQAVDKTHYQELIGSIMYLAVGTRPDISFTVSYLSQYCKEPGKVHLEAVKRVYRYMKGTKELVLKFDRQELEIQASTDASWNSTADAKSYSGYIVKMGNNSIGWKSRKQSLVTMSTCEAELIAICEGAREVLWLRNLLNSLNVVVQNGRAIILYTDSKAAIDWTHKKNVTNRTKHINRIYYFIRDEVKDKILELKHISTDEMMADVLTKALPAEKHLLCTNSFKLQVV